MSTYASYHHHHHYYYYYYHYYRHIAEEDERVRPRQLRLGDQHAEGNRRHWRRSQAPGDLASGGQGAP